MTGTIDTQRTSSPGRPGTEQVTPAAHAAPGGSAPTPTGHHLSPGGVLDAVMANPLVGLSPWIVYSLVEGNNRLELSAAIALGMAFAIVLVNWVRGGTPKMLEWSDVVYFGALAVVVAFAGDDLRSWLELWGGEVANVALFLIMFLSVVIRRPFTLQYARESAPREVWHTPEFMRVNYLISWVWVGAMAIQAASGWFGDAVLENSNNIWTGWIIQTLPLIIAAQFTIWYPNRLQARREGHIDDAPSVREFLATITPWLTVIGIVVLATGGAPAWLAIGFIVAGAVLTRALSTKRPAASADASTAPTPA